MRMLAITEELGRVEDFFSDVVYPVWPLWVAAAILAVGAALLVAYRLGWHRWAMRHRFISAGILAGVLVVGIPAGWYTISPLFERSTVCEASPIAGAGAGSEKCEGVAMAAANATSTPADGTVTIQPTATVTQPPAFEPKVVARGDFQGADDFHFGRGQALLIETAPGQYTLRFENFSVRNGPDLFVYLSKDPGSNDGLLLGGLKGTDGAFNYDVPAGTDIAQYNSAVVWCRQFAVLFATAAFA